MDLVEAFLKTPSEGLLERCTREQLVKIAEHFDMEVGDKCLKDNMKTIIKENLSAQGVLHQQPRPDAAALDPAGAAAASVDSGAGVLTSEQREQLLMLEVNRLELEERRSRLS